MYILQLQKHFITLIKTFKRSMLIVGRKCTLLFDVFRTRDVCNLCTQRKKRIYIKAVLKIQNTYLPLITKINILCVLYVVLTLL